jgi:hypothetical protein
VLTVAVARDSGGTRGFPPPSAIRAIATSVVVAAIIERAGTGAAIVRDLLDGARYRVAQRDRAGALAPGDVILGRLLPGKKSWIRSHGVMIYRSADPADIARFGAMDPGASRSERALVIEQMIRGVSRGWDASDASPPVANADDAGLLYESVLRDIASFRNAYEEHRGSSDISLEEFARKAPILAEWLDAVRILRDG